MNIFITMTRGKQLRHLSYLTITRVVEVQSAETQHLLTDGARVELSSEDYFSGGLRSQSSVVSL